MVRIKFAKLIILFIITIVCFLIWRLLTPNIIHYSSTCKMSDEYLKELEVLMKRVNSILESYSIRNILCYGSLWSQIRNSKLLPWTKKAEFCIFKEEIDKINEKEMRKSFDKDKLKINYNMFEGFYTIEGEKSANPFVEIYVFQRDDTQNVFKRIGLVRTLLPPNCEWTKSLDCFPTNLIQQTLPKKLLGSDEYFVPNGGIELQKYHYSQNWWKDVKLKNCNV